MLNTETSTTSKVSFANWIFPNEATIRADFDEYKKKEDAKWRERARHMGFRFPIFETYENFDNALRSAAITELTAEQDQYIMNRSHCRSISALKSLVNSYTYPRDVDRIVDGYNTNAAMPMPIVLWGKHGQWIMTGNTRLDTAFILGIKPQIMEVKAF